MILRSCATLCFFYFSQRPFCGYKRPNLSTNSADSSSLFKSVHEICSRDSLSSSSTGKTSNVHRAHLHTENLYNRSETCFSSSSYLYLCSQTSNLFVSVCHVVSFHFLYSFKIATCVPTTLSSICLYSIDWLEFPSQCIPSLLFMFCFKSVHIVFSLSPGKRLLLFFLIQNPGIMFATRVCAARFCASLALFFKRFNCKFCYSIIKMVHI